MLGLSVKKIVTVVAVAAAFIFCFYLYGAKYGVSKAQRPTRFPETRTVVEADFWLSWSHSERINFLKGYLAGYQHGRRTGCIDAEAMVRDKRADYPALDLWPECFSKGSRFGNGLDSYEKAMTELYSKYPADRDLPLSLLLDKLSDSEHMTTEEIHRWLATMNSKQ